MYKVSEYSNNNHEREDASMKEERTAIEIDTGDAFQDNDYNMSADEDISEKPADSINEGERIDEIEDELLSSGDEDLGAEMHKIGTEVGGDSYRNSVVEFNSEDEIENLEEDEQTPDKETENINEDEKSDYLSNDSVVELDELNNFEDHDDVQEIPPPSNNSMHKREDSGYNNQETLEVREHEELIEDDQDEYDQDEYDQDEYEQDDYDQDENDQDENEDDKIKEIEVNSGGANQEIFEELDNEGFDKAEHGEIKEEREENDVKYEKEKDDDDEKEDEGRKKEEEELEEKEIEVQREQQEDDDGKPANEQAGYREVRKNEYSNDEKDEVRPDKENMPASSNISIQSKMPNSRLESTFPIIINIAETDFLLVPFDKHRDPEIDVSHLVSLYDDNEILKLTIEEFFGLMRTNEDLNEIHQFTVNKELVLVIPELNLSITEDNIYSRDITIEDFIVSFENLNSNSINDGEELVHKSLSFLLTSQTRFITNFNNLTESIRRGKGFNCVSLENSVREPIVIAPEARTEDSHKRQSLDSSDESDAQQTKRAKVSI